MLILCLATCCTPLLVVVFVCVYSIGFYVGRIMLSTKQRHFYFSLSSLDALSFLALLHWVEPLVQY